MTERLKSLEPCRCAGCGGCIMAFKAKRVCLSPAEYRHSGSTWCPGCLDELKQRKFEEWLNSFIDSQAKKEH